MDLLEFTFANGWHFFGVLLLLIVVLYGAAECIGALRGSK